MKIAMRQQFLLIGLLCFSPNIFAESTERPDVHVGDRWVWQHTNGLVDEMDRTQIEDVVEVTDHEIKTRARVKGRPGSGIMAYTKDWNPVDVGSARYAPFLKTLDFPLEVGKKWTSEADKMLFSNGKHGKFFVKGEVAALEKIVVPGGTFDAFRINLSLEAAGTDEDVEIGHTVQTIWYAPSVKRYVKLESTFARDGRERSKDVYELLEFSLRQ